MMQNKSELTRRMRVLIGGSDVLALLVLGVIWALVSSPSGSEITSPPTGRRVVVASNAPVRNGLDLAYLPLGVESIVSLRIADCIRAPALQPLLASPVVEQAISDFRSNLGLGPEDIHSVTIGMASVSERAKQQAQAGKPPVGLPTVSLKDLGRVPTVMVVQTTSPMDQRMVLDYAAKLTGGHADEISAVSHDGESYHRLNFRRGEGSQWIAIYFPNDETMVMGTEEDVKSAIARGDTAQDRPDLDFVDVRPHLVAVAGEQNAPADLWPDPTGDQWLELEKAIRNLTKRLGVGVTVTDVVVFQMQFACADSAAADELRSQFDTAFPEQIAKSRQMIAQTKKKFEDLIASGRDGQVFVESLDLLDAIFTTAQWEKSGHIVIARASTPSSAGSTLAKFAQRVADDFLPLPRK